MTRTWEIISHDAKGRWVGRRSGDPKDWIFYHRDRDGLQTFLNCSCRFDANFEIVACPVHMVRGWWRLMHEPKCGIPDPNRANHACDREVGHRGHCRWHPKSAKVITNLNNHQPKAYERWFKEMGDKLLERQK